MPRRRADAHSNDLFQALVENSSDAIALLDGEGVIRFASDSSARVLGYRVEERLGHGAFELMHPDDESRARAAFAECLRRPGVPVASESRVRHDDGTWRHVEMIAVNRLNERAVRAIVVNYRDVTERRRTEEALRASEERLRHLVEQAQDIIYYCDPNGRFTYVNPTAARVLKYAEGELVGRHFMTLIRRDYRHTVGDLYARQLRERTPSTYFEFPALAKDGESIWVGQHVQLFYSGQEVAGVQAIARDITRQKDAEEVLRRSEARYRSLIHGAAYGIYRTTMDGRILDANPAFATMLGYDSVEELLTFNISAFYLVPGERAEIVERYLKFGRHDRMTTLDVDWKRKDGTPINVRLAARVVELDRASCFEGVAQDITAKRLMEEQLREAQKMEAVGRLARGVAHDFNNVLAAILGCADLLALRLTPGDPSMVEAEEIQKAAERGANLTRQLLAFSRRRALEPELLDLHAVARGVDSMLARLAEHVELRLHTPGDPPIVRAERGQVEQVLFNLVVNARDAMPDGGTIDVAVEAIELDDRKIHAYPSIAPGRFARISVHDTGIGIAPEMQRHVFEPFFSTKDPARGTGLGLSIVYGIAKEAGGTVTFSTHSVGSSHGTTFEVLLPLAANQ